MNSQEKRLEDEEKSAAQKRKELFDRQKQTLDLFLERKAISQEQYHTGLQALINQMKIQ